MKNKIQTLIKSSIQLVNSYNQALSLQVQAKSQNVLSNLDLALEDLNLIQQKNKKAIGIRNLFQHSLLRLTIYYLPKGITMKLHDHNQMKVISKILKGQMQVKLYKHKQLNIYEKSVKILNQNQLMFIEGNKSFNLHQFKAIEPTCFLDIIFPDYSFDNDCKFFEQEDSLNDSTVKLKEIKDVQVLFQDI